MLSWLSRLSRAVPSCPACPACPAWFPVAAVGGWCANTVPQRGQGQTTSGYERCPTPTTLCLRFALAYAQTTSDRRAVDPARRASLVQHRSPRSLPGPGGLLAEPLQVLRSLPRKWSLTECSAALRPLPTSANGRRAPSLPSPPHPSGRAVPLRRGVEARDGALAALRGRKVGAAELPDGAAHREVLGHRGSGQPPAAEPGEQPPRLRRPSAAVGDGVGAAAGAGALHGVGAGARVQVGVGTWGVGARADAPRLQWSDAELSWSRSGRRRRSPPIAVPIATAGMERWGEDREGVEGVATVR